LKTTARYGQTTTLYIGDTVPLSKYIPGNVVVPDRISKQFFTTIFQIYCACFVAGVHLIEHNDLHPDNIRIQPRQARNVNCKITSRQKVGGTTTILDVNFTKLQEVYIFDWDLAHSHKIGDNPRIENKRNCGLLHRCNHLVDRYPKTQRQRISALRNMITITAWLSGCDKNLHLKRNYDNMINYLITLVSLPAKVGLTRELFGRTCLSNFPIGIDADETESSPFIKRRQDGDDDALGMGDRLKTGAFYLDPRIYAPGVMFKDPISILVELGKVIHDPTIDATHAGMDMFIVL
jgi:hypothetical protein